MSKMLCDVAEIIDSLHKTPNYKANGIPMVRVVDVKNDFLNLENCFTVDESTCNEHNKNHVPQMGDVIITRVGSYGMLAYVNTGKKFCLGQNIAIISPKENGKFLYYYLKSPFVQSIIYGNSGGSSYKCISLEEIKKLPYYDDNLDVKKIGELLYSIDSKIENNNKINTELESMAKTIYDYWFLQFEFPNEDGKPYKSSGGRMVWNEELKREIPEGWRVCRVKDCITHINTGLNPRNNFVLGNGGIKYITVKNLMPDGKLDFLNCDTIDENAREIVHRRSDISKGDILFASIAPLGRCFLIQEEPMNWDINESVFSIRPNYDSVTSEYLYMFFMSSHFIKKAEHNSIGSVFNGIRISTLENMLIIVPQENIMNQFQNSVQQLLLGRHYREKESNELTSLREFLLPLLMNGQVGFKD